MCRSGRWGRHGLWLLRLWHRRWLRRHGCSRLRQPCRQLCWRRLGLGLLRRQSLCTQRQVRQRGGRQAGQLVAGCQQRVLVVLLQEWVLSSQQARVLHRVLRLRVLLRAKVPSCRRRQQVWVQAAGSHGLQLCQRASQRQWRQHLPARLSRQLLLQQLRGGGALDQRGIHHRIAGRWC